MSGDNDTTFRPMDTLTAQEINAAFVKALGYTVEWDMVNEKATELGIAVDAADDTLVLRGEAFKAIRAALDVVPMDKEMTLGEELTLEGYVAPVAPVTALEVESFEMTNYKEAVVKFNQELDADTVVLANFVGPDANSIAAVTLLADKMTVELTLVDGEEVAQYGSLEVVINDVKSATGEEIAEDTTVEVEFVVDLAVPTVVSVEAIGNSGVKVTYSEPVNHAASITNYYLNGKLFAGSESIANKVSTLDLTKRLEAGVHELTIRANKVDDFADLFVKEVVVEFVVEEDATAPTGDVTSATQTEVVIEFTEAIDSVAISTIAGATPSWNADKTVLTLTYLASAPVPVNGTTITLTNITDAYGNVTDKLELESGYPVIDLTRPEVKETTVSKQDYIMVTFTENVDITSAVFKLKDADGAVVETLSAAFYVDSDSTTHYDMVKLTGTLAPETYSLSIEGVVDASPLANGLVPVVPTVVVPDATKVEVSSITIDGNNLFVLYSEKVDEATATDKANYSYTAALVNKAFAATEAFTLLEDGKTVKIAFTADTTDVDSPDAADVDVLQIAGVQDLSGNVITTVATASTSFGSLGLAPVVDSAEVTGENTVVLSLTGDIVGETLAPTDFAIVASTTAISVLDTVYDATKDTITLTINADLDANGQYDSDDLTITMNATTGYTVQAANVYGQKLVVSGASITSTEAIVPTVTLGDITAGGTATLTFSEDIAAAGVGRIVVFVNNVFVADTFTTATATTATVTFTTAVAKDDVVRVLYYTDGSDDIQDLNGNKAANFDLTKTVTE
jgi:hypothetical protein